MSPSEEATQAAEQAWRLVSAIAEVASPTTETAWKAGYVRGYDDGQRNLLSSS